MSFFNHKFLAIAIAVMVLLQFVGAEEQPKKVESEIPEFIPTDEYQEILPGQAVPAGLSYKIDFETGKKYARLLHENEKNTKENTGVLVSSSPAEPLEGVKTDATVQETSTIPKEKINEEQVPEEEQPKETPDQFKERVLLELDDIEELKNISKYTDEERKILIDTIWVQRQKMLEEAFAQTKTEMEQLIEELGALKNETNYKNMNVTIDNIEYLLQDMDNALFFHSIDGYSYLFSTLTSLYNNTLFDAMYKAESDEDNRDYEQRKETYIQLLNTMGTLFKHSLDTNITHPNHISMLNYILNSLDYYYQKYENNHENMTIYEPILRKYFYILGNLIRNKPYIFTEFINNKGSELVLKYLNMYKDMDINATIYKLINLYNDILITYANNQLVSPSSSLICSQYIDIFTGEDANFATKQSIIQTLYYYSYYSNNKDQCIEDCGNSISFLQAVSKFYNQVYLHATVEDEDQEVDGYFKTLKQELESMFKFQ
ncbi:hypothetical protein WA158_008258 [Blastocystis sp. Blastoise]